MKYLVGKRSENGKREFVDLIWDSTSAPPPTFVFLFGSNPVFSVVRSLYSGHLRAHSRRCGYGSEQDGPLNVEHTHPFTLWGGGQTGDSEKFSKKRHLKKKTTLETQRERGG